MGRRLAGSIRSAAPLGQGPVRLRLGIEAERRESPAFGLYEWAGTADRRVLGQVPIEW